MHCGGRGIPLALYPADRPHADHRLVASSGDSLLPYLLLCLQRTKSSSATGALPPASMPLLPPSGRSASRGSRCRCARSSGGAGLQMALIRPVVAATDRRAQCAARKVSLKSAPRASPPRRCMLSSSDHRRDQTRCHQCWAAQVQRTAMMERQQPFSPAVASRSCRPGDDTPVSRVPDFQNRTPAAVSDACTFADLVLAMMPDSCALRRMPVNSTPASIRSFPVPTAPSRLTRSDCRVSLIPSPPVSGSCCNRADDFLLLLPPELPDSQRRVRDRSIATAVRPSSGSRIVRLVPDFLVPGWATHIAVRDEPLPNVREKRRVRRVQVEPRNRRSRCRTCRYSASTMRTSLA